MAKSTKNKNNGEVLELIAEEVPVPIEQQIENTLIKHNVTEAVIAGLKDKFGSLRLKSIDDKESYLEVCEGRKEVRKWGILCERITKKGREDAIAIQRKWLAKEKEIMGKIAEVQDPLDAEINKYEREVERKELQELARREDAYVKRQHQLLRMGATYQDGSFVLNHISYEATLVKESDDDIWTETILPKYQREYEKNEQERVAIEKKREEEAAKMKAEREALELQQAEFKKQQDLFLQQQAEMQKQKDEILRQERLEQQKKEDEENRKRQELVSNRINQIGQLGLRGNGRDAYYFGDDICVLVSEIQSMPTDKWNTLIEEITPIIEDKKADIEVKRQEENKKREQAAIELALAEEKEKQRKLAEQIELDRKRAEEQKAEQLAKSSDKKKWEHLLTDINSIGIPEMKSGEYRKAVQYVNKYFIEINGYFK